MRLSDIDTQREAAERLRQAIEADRLPHALLLSGREGSGAMTLALAAAQYILCERRGQDPAGHHDACGQCAQCIQVEHLQHPDLHFVYPVVNKRKAGDASTSADYAQEWRTMLMRNPEMTLLEWTSFISSENKQAQIFVSEAAEIVRRLSIKPFESDYRVMIIWLPERLKEDAANKLLKIIEEPYEKTHFLLVSADPDRIIGTILSRCQRFNLPPVRPNWMQPQLADDDRADYLDLFIRLMRDSYMRRLTEMKAWSEEMAELSRPAQIAFLQYAQSQIRENFILGAGAPDIIYQEADEAKFSSRFAPYVNYRNVEGMMQELSLAEGDVSQNGNARIIFFDLALKFIMLLKQQ